MVYSVNKTGKHGDAVSWYNDGIQTVLTLGRFNIKIYKGDITGDADVDAIVNTTSVDMDLTWGRDIILVFFSHKITI